MKILNFGSCNIDRIYSLERIVEAGETKKTHEIAIVPGGKGLNQSVAIAKAGAKVYHAGCVGNDGQMLIELLARNGVDVSYLKPVNEKSGHAIIQVSSEGDNAIFAYPGANERITKEFIDTVLKDFDKDDMILLQNEINNLDYIVERAYQKEMCIILNPSPLNEKVKALNFDMLSYLILNEAEAREISGQAEPEECLRYFKNQYPQLKVVLTLGQEGSVLMDGERELRQAAFVVDVVDTTSAGDAFTGYVVAELSKGTEYRKILKLASAAAAVVVSRKGAAQTIPDKREVLPLLDSLKEYVVKKGRPDFIRQQIKDYIGENIKTANLEELAALLGYSAAHTGNLVKKLMGESFTKIVQTERCTIAAQKLLDMDLSVKEIVAEVGYENESFFRKIFKEKYGQNPLHYRKKNL